MQFTIIIFQDEQNGFVLTSMTTFQVNLYNIFAQMNRVEACKIRQEQTWPGCVICHQTNKCPSKFKRYLRTKHTPNLSYFCDYAIYGNNNVLYQGNSICFCAIHNFGLPSKTQQRTTDLFSTTPLPQKIDMFLSSCLSNRAHTQQYSRAAANSQKTWWP